MTLRHRSLLVGLLHSDSAMPSGSFAFSWGLEELYDDEVLSDKERFSDVLEWYLVTRWASFDRFFVHHSFLASPERRRELDLWCTAASTGAAGRESSVRAGRALLLAWSRMGLTRAADFTQLIHAGEVHGNLPIVQGLIYAECGMDQSMAAGVSGWTFLSNLASAAVRMGHVSALASQKALIDTLDGLAELLDSPIPETPTSWGVIQDIAMERHALRTSRLFAS
ncbi:urease accessory protein UreF [Microbacterium sp.]|uniref:urease accessory protein UreF n=1 Tax=Microbacterium sp. TaxID=51671 RepID=UPI003A93509D